MISASWNLPIGIYVKMLRVYLLRYILHKFVEEEKENEP